MTMPILPENKGKYPKDWKSISHTIRFERAGGRCEWTDESGHRCLAAHGQPHPVTGSKVVLTVMHLDHDPQNNDPGNLCAACQMHHNLHDARHRAANRQKRRNNDHLQ
jgi:hypothetical protein